MRKASRAIIIEDDKILLIKRNKFGLEYYTLPGGAVDMSETPEQTLVREMLEETSMNIVDFKLSYIEEAGNMYGTQYIYVGHVNPIKEPVIDQNAPEAKINELGKNLHQPVWLDIADLTKIPLRSQTLKEVILYAINNGFPNQPQTFKSNEDIRYNK